DRVAGVAQYRIRELVLIGGEEGVLRLLGRNCYEARTRFANAWQHLLPDLQGCDAVRAPAPAIEVDNQRPARQQFSGADDFAVLVRQSKLGSFCPDRQNTITQARLLQFN